MKKSGDMLLQDAIRGTELYNRARRLSPRTWEWTTTKLKIFADWCQEEGVSALREIDKHLLQKFLASRNHLSPHTIRGDLMVLRNLYKWALDENLVDEDPSRDLEVPALPRPHKTPLTIPQIHQYLQAFDETTYAQYRDKTIALLILDTGLRVAEISNLEVGDVDLSRELVVVRKGKRGKGRDVPISPSLLSRLHVYMVKWRPAPTGAQRFFLTERGDPMRRDLVSKALIKAGKRADLHVYGHLLRHTFAKHFLKNGGDLFSLQEILGHSDISTTRRYVQMDADMIRESHRRASPMASWNEEEPLD